MPQAQWYLKIPHHRLVVGPEHPEQLRDHHLDHELQVARVHHEVSVHQLEAPVERLVAPEVRVEPAVVGHRGVEQPRHRVNRRGALAGRGRRPAHPLEVGLLDDEHGLLDPLAAERARVDRAPVVVARAEQVPLQAPRRVAHAEPAGALGLDVLLHADPPRPQVPGRDERAQRVRLVAVVLAQHERRVRRPVVAQEVGPRLPDRLLRRAEVLRARL